MTAVLPGPLPRLLGVPATRAARVVATAAGGALAATTRAVAAVRPADKPLHPAGTVVRGVLTRHGAGSAPLTGVDLLDRAGQTQVTARLSRAVGLPRPVPDIWGLALRLQHEGETGDLLFASTGWDGPLRYLLTPRREGSDRPLTTLLPYRTPTGAVVLGARSLPPAPDEAPDDDHLQRWVLCWARGLGSWHAFAHLELDHPVADAVDGEDAPIEFDPVLHQVPGLAQYPALARLRRPSYRVAQRTH